MRKVKINLMRKESRKISGLLGTLDSVVAIASFGSLFIKNLKSEPRDIDLAIFCSKIPKKSTLRKCLKPVVKEWWSDWDPIETRAAFTSRNDNQVDLALISIKFIERKLDDFKMKTPPHWQLVSSVYYSKTLYDPKAIIKKYRKEMTPFPSWLRIHFRNSIGTTYFFMESEWIKGELEKGNKTLVNYRLVMMKEELDHLLFAVNRKYYFHPKHVEREYKTLKLIPKNYAKLSDAFSDTRGVSLKKRIEILYKMARGLERVIKSKAPELLK
ncbi:MAG: hypothetical protein JSV39_02690 [Candidatus Aenigmatarchaeota archaeon]|nr:MAG: hypothetical protein JSV39_02690 [Candidatus Aenigmarchaeota archaeon]